MLRADFGILAIFMAVFIAVPPVIGRFRKTLPIRRLKPPASQPYF